LSENSNNVKNVNDNPTDRSPMTYIVITIKSEGDHLTQNIAVAPQFTNPERNTVLTELEIEPVLPGFWHQSINHYTTLHVVVSAIQQWLADNETINNDW